MAREIVIKIGNSGYGLIDIDDLWPEEERRTIEGIEKLVDGIILSDRRRILEVLDDVEGALQFYQDNFVSYKQHKNLPGFAWKPG